MTTSHWRQTSGSHSRSEGWSSSRSLPRPESTARKLSNLLNLRGGLATDNLLLICDWLGRSLYEYRQRDVPDWLVTRLAEANQIDPESARELAERRAWAAQSYAQLPPVEHVMAEAAARLHATQESLRVDSRR